MISKHTVTADRAAPRTNQPTPAEGIQPKGDPQTAQARWERTALAAFYRAQARGFGAGRELEDWLEAERELDAADAFGEPEGHSLSPLAPESQQGTAPARKRAGLRRGESAPDTTIQARNRGDEP